jgi:hypothetical protein
MPIFWIVHQADDGARVVRVEQARAAIFARLQALIGKLPGTFVEAHQLDAATAKRIPAKLIGKTLTATEAKALIERVT